MIIVDADVVVAGRPQTLKKAKKWPGKLGDTISPKKLLTDSVLINSEDDDSEIPVGCITEITNYTVYGKGLIPVSEGFIPVASIAEATITTTYVDDEDEVIGALQAIADGNKAKRAGKITKLVPLLTDDGKSYVRSIANDKDSDLTEVAKLVVKALNKKD